MPNIDRNTDPQDLGEEILVSQAVAARTTTSPKLMKPVWVQWTPLRTSPHHPRSG